MGENMAVDWTLICKMKCKHQQLNLHYTKKTSASKHQSSVLTSLVVCIHDEWTWFLARVVLQKTHSDSRKQLTDGLLT